MHDILQTPLTQNSELVTMVYACFKQYHQSSSSSLAAAAAVTDRVSTKRKEVPDVPAEDVS